METRDSYRSLLFIVAFLVLFASSTFFRIRDYADKSVDLQAGLKLAGIALTLLIPLAALLSGRLILSTALRLVWIIFLISLIFCSIDAPQPSVSLTGSIALLGGFLFCIWMAERFGETDTVAFMITSVGILSALSLIAYYVNPELGRMHAWLGNEFGANNRIRGIVGSANGLGSMTSMTLIYTVLYYSRMGPVARSLAIASAPFALLCLLMSNNRMSMVALVICVAIWLAAKGNKALNIGLLCLAGLVVVFAVLAAPDVILGAMSRSGDVQEIATGTGRSQIWAVVLELVAQKPLLGHGYASAASILPLDPRLFSVAAHTHNMYLELLFSGGILSIILFLAALGVTLYQGFAARCFEPMIVLAFFLFRGLMEPTPFSGPPSVGGYIFFLSVAFISLRSREVQSAAALVDAREAQIRLERCKANLRGASFASDPSPRRS